MSKKLPRSAAQQSSLRLVLAFPELGMKAIYEFEVENMPVTVAVDSTGNSVHDSGPREWRMKIGKITVRKG